MAQWTLKYARDVTGTNIRLNDEDDSGTGGLILFLSLQVSKGFQGSQDSIYFRLDVMRNSVPLVQLRTQLEEAVDRSVRSRFLPNTVWSSDNGTFATENSLAEVESDMSRGLRGTKSSKLAAKPGIFAM